jgi:taspase, threonine aspartase, 1
MVSPRAKSEWQKWKARLDSPEMNLLLNSASIHDLQDTVGAVVWAKDGGMAAGVSRRVVHTRLNLV